jgi:ATP adenylyltransferase
MTYLWTPWRAVYMKEKGGNEGCVFCGAARGVDDAKSLVVYRGEFSFAILNRYPYTSGHLMIAPYEHASRLGEISEDTAQELMLLTRRAERLLQQTYEPDGLNLGMNLGEAAGAGIEQHIHMHVLPRWRGDANFMTSVGNTRIIPEVLEVTYQKLHAAFNAF